MAVAPSDASSVTHRYLYRSTKSSSRHRGNVGTYYVEIVNDDTKVIASIQSIGLCRNDKVDFKMNLFVIQQRMTMLGDWKDSPSGLHEKKRIALGRVE